MKKKKAKAKAKPAGRWLTLAQLDKYGICSYYRDRFVEEYGTKVWVTVAKARRAPPNAWNAMWLAEKTLPLLVYSKIVDRWADGELDDHQFLPAWAREYVARSRARR